MNFFQFIFLLCLIGCSQSQEIEQSEKLSAKTEEHYSYLKNRESVVGYFHYQSCDEETTKHLRFLGDSATKEELLFMLNDSCEKAFKVFLVEKTHEKFPEMDSLILENHGSDSTEIKVVTSCLGILTIIKFGNICNNIISNNTISIVVIAPPPLPPFF